MLSMKKFGTAVAAASLLAMVGAGSASAANWSPANSTKTAHGSLTLTARPTGGSVTCTYHSGVRSTGTDAAFTTTPTGTVAAPPTFSGCTSTIAGVSHVTAVADAAWTLTATSTTSVDVIGNATVTLFATTPALVDVCTITATNANVPTTFANATGIITPLDTLFPITETGIACPGDTQGTMTGSVTESGLTIL
jgi:hypothetical protein